MTDIDKNDLLPRGSRRVVYNSDPSNTIRFLSAGGATPDELRQVVRNYADSGAIDTLVQEIWSQGWSHWWRSETCEYDARPRHERLIPMIDEGKMPVEFYIDECHQHGMEFIAGFRMNDRHGHNADWFHRLSQEKPEWILKGYEPSSKRTTDPRSYDLGCALNYAVESVRDWVFSIMEEATNRFDIDGIEFNFQRLPACFPPGEAEESHAILTAFVQRVRLMLDGFGKERGRRLILGVRVLKDLDSCRTMGFDIPTWIAEGLIDYIAPGDLGFTDPNARIEEFVKIARKYNCYVYPQIQENLGYDYRHILQTAEHCHATVGNFFGAGADGFSTQNIFATEKHAMIGMLREPNQIAKHDRHYVFYPIWGRTVDRNEKTGYTTDFPYHAEEIDLNRKTPGVHGTFRFRICEHLSNESEIDRQKAASSATLLFRPSIVPGDEIEIDINGHTIVSEDIQYQWPVTNDELPVCSFRLTSPPAVYGDNYLGIKILKSAPDATENIVLLEVEVLVKAGG